MLSRRRTFVAGAVASLLPLPLGAQAARHVLRLQTRQVEVNGKAATRYGITQSSGAYGLTLDEGGEFNVRLENGLSVPSGIHWHGLTPPWRQDGVPWISAPPIPARGTADYRFPAKPAGTRWMHSHFGLQEQNLLAAPLIIRETAAIASGQQEVVVMFEDFSWTPPQEILANLRKPKPMVMSMGRGMGGSGMSMGKPDLNDVTFDAFLANDRTLGDPTMFEVERGAQVRLRLINGSASSNFVVDLGALDGTLVTVDGNPVTPRPVRRFPLAIAQRADIVVRIPPDAAAALPILAVCEGRTLRTGFLLRPRGAAVAKVSETAEAAAAEAAAAAVTLADEKVLRAAVPLPVRRIDRSVPVDLIGDMAAYTWGLQVHGMGGAPVTVDRGERVELVMRNTTMMSHPMHLHGHNFQVTEIDGEKIAGAVRDTVLVTPMATVKVVFDADNPGLWPFHCHNLYHMAAGMFTTVVYRGFS